MIKKGIDEKKNIHAYDLIEKYIIVIKFGLEMKITGSRRKVYNISSRY